MRRYGLVRVRENAESIAFYGGEDNEQRLLNSRLKAAIGNFLGERAGGPHGTSVWAVRDTDYGGGRPRTPEPVAGLLSSGMGGVTGCRGWACTKAHTATAQPPSLTELLKASRNLSFFTSFYRFLIQVCGTA